MVGSTAWVGAPENFHILKPKKWRVFDSDDFFPLQNWGDFLVFLFFSGF